MQSNQNPFGYNYTGGGPNPYYRPDAGIFQQEQQQALINRQRGMGQGQQQQQQGGGILDFLAQYQTPPIVGRQQPWALPQGASLEYLTANNVDFPTMNYGYDNIQWPTYPQAGQGGGGQPGGGGQAQVNSGITQPAMPGMPQAQAAPRVSGMSPGALQAYHGRSQALAAAPLAQAQGQYYGQQAGMNDQFQQARSQSGLGWGGLANQGQANARGQQLGQMNNLLGFLQGMRW